MSSATRIGLALVVSRLQISDVLYPLAEVAIGLRIDAPGAAKQVEVVDVRRAEIDLECLEQVGQRHALRLGLDAIDLDIKLWHVGLVANEGKAHAWRLHHRGLQRVGRLLERAVARARTVFDEQRIARALAETEDRWRVQHGGKSALDLGDLGL